MRAGVIKQAGLGREYFEKGVDCMEHFGEKLVKRKYSWKLCKEEFAIINQRPSVPKTTGLEEMGVYEYDQPLRYTKVWCEYYHQLCLQNYDLNMAYFASLNEQEFEQALHDFLEKHPNFEQVTRLRDYEEAEGYYLMILGEYRQAYLGKAANIRKRIRQHWSAMKPFDRTLWPMYAAKSSCFSIEMFRALDTTQIFVWKCAVTDVQEQDLIEAFPSKFLTNRASGEWLASLAAADRTNYRG